MAQTQTPVQNASNREGNSRGADLHPLPVGKLLKLLAWPLAVFAFGFAAMGLHLLEMGGWL